MDTIKKVSFMEVLGRVDRVYVEFTNGRMAHFDIREDETGKRRIFSKPSLISQEEIAAVKAVAKVDGKWTEYGYDEERARNREIIELVESGKYEYTYDNQGRITGCIEIKTKSSNLFGSMYDGMG